MCVCLFLYVNRCIYTHIHTHKKSEEEWWRFGYSRQKCAKKVKKLRNFRAAGTR